MIFAHNKNIIGIYVNSKTINRVYNGENLVWFRNRTSDHFDIIGSDTIYGWHTTLYKIRYAGYDDVSYTWTFSNVTPEVITYNRSMRKARVNIPRQEHIGEYMTISVVMTRKDGTTLTSTKNVLVIENPGITSFTIGDTMFDVIDSSCYVEYNIIPEGYTYYSVYDSSVDDNRLYISEYVDGGMYVSKVHPEDSSVYSTKIYATIIDDNIDVPYNEVLLHPEKYVKINDVWRELLDASANLHIVPELETFIINDEYRVGKGENLGSKIKIGVIVSQDVIYGNYIRDPYPWPDDIKFLNISSTSIGSINIYNSNEYINYGLGGVYELGTNIPYGSNGLRKFSTYTKEPYRGVVHWIDYDGPNDSSTYVPTLAEKRGSNICAYVSVVLSDESEIRQCVEIPQQFTDIENNSVRYVFRISNSENGITVTFDTELSSVLPC